MFKQIFAILVLAMFVMSFSSASKAEEFTALDELEILQDRLTLEKDKQDIDRAAALSKKMQAMSVIAMFVQLPVKQQVRIDAEVAEAIDY